MKKVISTENLPIKFWLDDIEEGALEQAKNLANLPFVFKWIAIMPDSHQGYGMPIGGVMATKGVIVPNAIGVDIGCLDKDTEVLSTHGWVKISKYNGECIAQYDKNMEKAEFKYPLKYIKQKSNGFYKLFSKYGLDQMLSEEHKIIFWNGVKNRGWKKTDYLAKDFVVKHNSLIKGIQGGFQATFGIKNPALEISESLLKVWVMVSADARQRSSKFELHFKKKRKIDRAEKLLTDAGIAFEKTIGKDGSVWIYFSNNKINKDLSKLWMASEIQLKIVADECLYWDGHIGTHKFYSTTIKENADIIQYAFAVSGIRAGIQRYSKKGWSDWYSVYTTKNNIVGIPPQKILKVPSEDGYEYCFTTDIGYFVARRNNKIFITGNCGMCAVPTSLRSCDVDTLKVIMGKIRESVPVGFSHLKESAVWEGFDNAPKIAVVQQELKKAHYQLGTLGGGNHFIEIQKGSDGYIWIMLHSGSRNFGLKIAHEYHEKAKWWCEKWHSNIPDKDLSFLPVETTEAKEYFMAMNFALDFAKENRFRMIAQIKNAFSSSVPEISFGEIINIHHNYAAWEHHFGEDVLVHRKGATLAREGTIGLIPGSQGTKSYIVKGKGNPDSFMSCSHGAGRKMGRKQAQRELDLETEQKVLDNQGIVHSIRSITDLDEAAGAYKDISVVMDNQSDLVDIIVELSPLAVIKA